MKHLLFLILSLIFICSASFAQNIQFGLKTGINLSSIKAWDQSSEYPYKPKIGYRFGLHTLVKVSDKWGIRTEILYSLDGTTAEGRYNSNMKIHLKRISIPIQFNYAPSDWINFEVGPEFNFLLNNKETSFLHRGNDYGISIGAEIIIGKKLALSLRNHFGLVYRSEIMFFDDQGTLLLDSNGQPIRADKNERNNILSLSVNYYLSK